MSAVERVLHAVIDASVRVAAAREAIAEAQREIVMGKTSMYFPVHRGRGVRVTSARLDKAQKEYLLAVRAARRAARRSRAYHDAMVEDFARRRAVRRGEVE